MPSTKRSALATFVALQRLQAQLQRRLDRQLGERRQLQRQLRQLVGDVKNVRAHVRQRLANLQQAQQQLDAQERRFWQRFGDYLKETE